MTDARCVDNRDGVGTGNCMGDRDNQSGSYDGDAARPIVGQPAAGGNYPDR